MRILLPLILVAFCGFSTAEEVVPDLWTATTQGDVKTLKSHYGDADLDALDPQLGITALTAAIISNQPKSAKWLIKNGADVNKLNADGGSSLQAAAFLGRSDVAKRLLKGGADILVRNASGQTAFDSLAADWQTTRAIGEYLQLTLDRGTVEKGREKIGKLLAPYLKKAARKDAWLSILIGDARILEKHLSSGFDPNGVHPELGTPLSSSSMAGNADVVKVLLENGAKVNGTGPDGSSVLHGAALFGRAEVVKALIDGGATIDLMNNDGSTPLQAAYVDWDTTAYIAGLLRIQLNQDAVMAGKKEVIGLLSAK